MARNGRAVKEEDEQLRQNGEAHSELPEGSTDGDTPTETEAGNVTPFPAAAAQEDALKKLQADRDALFDRVARQQAEFDNYRKRINREQADFRDFAVADAAKSFIQIMDSLDLALKAPHTGDDTDLRKGVELIRKQMEDALAKMGARPIPAAGEVFDPHLHEA